MPITLFDSHCHLPNLNHEDELQKQLADAGEMGVVRFLNIGTSIHDSVAANAVAGKYDNVFSSAAVYPHEEFGKDFSQLRAELAKIVDSPKVVAIGECGIDLPEKVSEEFRVRDLREQVALFEMQVQLALEKNLPVIIHNRNGDDIILKMLRKYQSQGIRGVIHCFSGDWDTAQKFLDLGFYISFSGFITYPSRTKLLETVRNVPADRFLVETDAPYLAPQGFRGQKNEPKYVRIVAEKVAETRNLPLEEIAAASYGNTCRLFGI